MEIQNIFDAIRVADKKVYKVQKKKDFYYYENGKNGYDVLYFTNSLKSLEKGYQYYGYYINGVLHDSFYTNVINECLADYNMKAEIPSSDVQLSIFDVVSQ